MGEVATSAEGMRSKAGTSAQGIRSQVGTSIGASIGNSVDSGGRAIFGFGGVFLGYDFGYGLGYGYPGYYPAWYCSHDPYGYNPAVGCYYPYPYPGPAY